MVEIKKDENTEIENFFKVVESWDYLVSTIFFIIMNVRAVSFPGWALPWYQWTFYNVDDENGASYISTCMDIFGLTFFMSLPFSFLPQLIIWICGKLGNIQKGKNQFRTILKDNLGTNFSTLSKPRRQLCRNVQDSQSFPP